MKLIAHRGKITKADIGNSKWTLLNALSKPYVDGIECDVRLTKDLEVVVIHSPIIDFASDGIGVVKYMTLKELKQYQFGSESILTLKELLEDIHSNKMICIELKEDNHELADKVIDIIAHYIDLNIVIISFWYSSLKYIKKRNPAIKVGLLIGYSLNNSKIYNHFDYNFFSYHYIEQIDMHKQIGFFTINQKEQVLKLLKRRSDIYIITDVSYELSKLEQPFPH